MLSLEGKQNNPVSLRQPRPKAPASPPGLLLSGQQRPAASVPEAAPRQRAKVKKEKGRMRSMLFISTFTFLLLPY
jgi:hypothetical protein